MLPSGKQRGSKVGTAQPEDASHQPASKKRKSSGGSGAAPEGKQKGKAAASQQETASEKPGKALGY